MRSRDLGWRFRLTLALASGCGLLACTALLTLTAVVGPGCSKDDVECPDVVLPGTSWSGRIYDYEYVKDRFFFLDDPTRAAYPDEFVVRIRRGSVHLYLDDGDGDALEYDHGIQAAVMRGYAVLNLEQSTPRAGDTLDGPLYFQELQYGSDFTVLIDDWNGTHPILVCDCYLEEGFTLGVTYIDQGRNQWVGGLSAADTMLYVKMIRPREDLLEEDLNQGPWGATNRLMMKNVYPLHQSLENWAGERLPERMILKDCLELAIHRRGDVNGVRDPCEVIGVSLVRLLGLDYFTDLNDECIPGQDGSVDDERIDFCRGYLFLPDLRPFSPGDSVQTDLRDRPGEPSTWDVLPREFWNPGIYDQQSCVRDRDRPQQSDSWASRYYFEIDLRYQ